MSENTEYVEQPYPSRLFTNEDFNQYSPSEAPQYGAPTSSGERGSPASTYSSGYNPSDPWWTNNALHESGNVGGFGGSSAPRGTPPMPSRSGSWSGPNLPPEQFQRLNQLLTNPNAITSDPGYKFIREQGEQALARTAASKKMALSGKADIDALQFGQGSAMQYLNQLIQQLLGASNASRTSMSGAVGPDPGTQGEYASQALIPVYQRLLSRESNPMPSMPALPTGGSTYGGMTPRLQSALDPRAETDQYLMNNPAYEMVGA